MNITEETNDYFSTIKEEKYKLAIDLCDSILKDKLKTTPDRGIKRISKVFRVNWSKILKRGWLLWK